MSRFRANGVVVPAVYEPSAGNMRQYLHGESVYATMIPNPDQSLYRQYGVEQSTGKMLNGIWHGAVGKMKQGKALYPDKIAMDGNVNRIGAEFLIDGHGTVVAAHYGRYLGDDLPMETIQRFVAE